jgi:hypothetical protein
MLTFLEMCKSRTDGSLDSIWRRKGGKREDEEEEMGIDSVTAT